MTFEQMAQPGEINFIDEQHAYVPLHGRGKIALINTATLQKEDETAIANLDKKNKIIHFKGKRTYTPVNVYKCLLKMALTVMPDSELPEITNAMDFLMDRKNIKGRLLVWYRQYGGISPFPTPVTMLFKRKDERVDETVHLYMFLLAYGNFAFQFHIPFCPADKFLFGKEISMPYIPTMADTINPQLLTALDFSSSEKITKEEYGIDMTFEGMKRNWIVHLPLLIIQNFSRECLTFFNIQRNWRR